MKLYYKYVTIMSVIFYHIFKKAVSLKTEKLWLLQRMLSTVEIKSHMGWIQITENIRSHSYFQSFRIQERNFLHL